MARSSTNTTPAISILGMLGIAFVVLKLCHVIDWSWWWVTCPFWGPVALGLVLLGLVLALALAFVGIKSIGRFCAK